MGYLAPEIHPGGGRAKRDGNREHGKAVDWYMLGVLVYEMVTGDMFCRVRGDDAEKIDELEGMLSEAGRRFLRGLLQRDPEKRLGTSRDAEEVKECEWLRSVDWEAFM